MRPSGCYPAPGQTRVSEVSITSRGRVTLCQWGHGARSPYGDAALLVTGRHILLFYTLMRVTGEGGGRAAAKHAAEKEEARGKE